MHSSISHVRYRCTECNYTFACRAFRPDCPNCNAGTVTNPVIEEAEQ